MAAAQGAPDSTGGELRGDGTSAKASSWRSGAWCAVALLIGTVELLSVLADKLSLTGGLWDVVAGLDLNLVGYAIVGLFVLTWALALAVWRFGRIEEKWSARLQ